ncbi:MAG: squalene synthase HpnC [Ignavibacteria bacterium]
MQKEYESAYEYCRNLAVSHYENFPVGSVLIPKDKRKYVYAVYAFSRYADDIADSSDLDANVKLEKLEGLETELDKIENKSANGFSIETKNIFLALFDTVNKLNIPVMEFRNLLSAFKQDSVGKVYKNFDELLDYSNRSANPVGHLVLYIFGYDPENDAKVFELSDKVCTALQLANFWQDVSVDLKMDRIYVPEDIMLKNNYSAKLLSEKVENEDFRKIINELADSTDELFETGSALTGLLSGRLKLEIKATINGGREIINKIREIKYNVLTKRVSLSKRDKFKIIFKAFIK